MQIVYRFEIRPTQEQEQKMFRTLRLCRHLYNRSLEERRATYKATGKSVTYSIQQNSLPAFKKENPEYRTVHSQVLQDVLRRVDRAYQNFFEGRAGYPRFRNRDNYRSFTYPQVDVVRETFQRDGCIYLSKIGFVKVIAHRLFEPERVFQINIIRKHNKWYANLTVELPDPGQTPGDLERGIGVDMGLLHFYALSDGTTVDTPRYLSKSEQKLAKLQRRLSRKKKGSKNRRKAKIKVAQCHEKIANQRKDFLHKKSYNLVTSNNVIVMEDLQIRNMAQNRHLAKSIHDASWSAFQKYVEYKCRKYGKQFVKVDPKDTSQTCTCGHPVAKDLSVRMHKCPRCGLEEDRDVVSAKLILERGLKKLTAA
ncbi:transposase [Clostridiales bacterium PH28_bin88]|nr:transposase [Clostridiales bacterium PH28_bin88]